jgi:D-alanine-D-alanine ligase
MRVALVYNQKKEDAAQRNADDNGEPPSRNGNHSRVEKCPPYSSSSIAPQSFLKSTSVSTLEAPASAKNDLYAEWDSEETILAVKSALAELHDVTMIEADEDVYGKLIEERPQIVFNIAEGMYGISREAQVPAMLEFLQIPYTGSDPLTLATCLDKSRAKEVLAYYGVPTPKFWVVSGLKSLAGISVPLPAMVKPLHEGSSKGIFNSSLVTNRSELEREVFRITTEYGEPAIVEEFLDGREFTVAMLGNGSQARVLPIVEINFDSLPTGVNRIYSYEAKWIWDRADNPLDIFQCPAHLSPELQKSIESVCLKAYNLLRCRDWCRIDVRLDRQNVPNIIELNPLPGILPNPKDNSCYPKAARAAGLSYNRLMQTVLALAAGRYRIGQRQPSFQPQYSGATP